MVLVVVGIVEVVDVVVDGVVDAPWSPIQCSWTVDPPGWAVFADAATISRLDCISNTPLDDRPHTLQHH